MPPNIAETFADTGGYSITDLAFSLRDFTVQLYGSRHFEADLENHYLQMKVVNLFVVKLNLFSTRGSSCRFFGHVAHDCPKRLCRRVTCGAWVSALAEGDRQNANLTAAKPA